MPPKPGKRGSAKKPRPHGGAVFKNWEADLARAQFEEESWQPCVSLVVGGSPADEELIWALALAVQQPQRRLFSLLTWDSTLAKIHELGNPKAKKPDDVPAFYEVTESAKVLLDAGEEIPCDLMAKILKFQLLQIKTNDQQRREAEQAEEEKAKAEPSSANKDKAGAKVSDKKGKGPPSPVGPSKEKKTKLKRRDDVLPPKFIDDEPEDGPQHYILVLGFYQPHLIGALDAIDVHVANVIRLCGQQEQPTCEGHEGSRTASTVLDGEVQIRGGVELAVLERKLDLFWSGLRAVLDSGPRESKLHDVVQLSYTVPDPLPPFHTQDPETQMEAGGQLFEGVASLIYDSLDWHRQHQHYLDSMKRISVPTVVGCDLQPLEDVTTPLSTTPRSKKKSGREESQKIKQPSLTTDVDMRYYDTLLDLVPPEACSVPLILHCMLEQVCVHIEDKIQKAYNWSLKVVVSTEQPLSTQPHVDEEPKAHGGPSLDPELASDMLESFLPLVYTKEEKSHMLNNLLTLVQNEEDKKRLAETFGAQETQEKSEHPLVIRHHDKRELALRDIKETQGFNPTEVELSMMKRSPVWELIHSVTQQENSNSCWMAVKQQLKHYCTDDGVSWSEVEHLIHQSVFESMPLTSLDQRGVLLNAIEPQRPLEPAQQETPTIIPWDNPLFYAKQQLNNLRTKGPMFLTEEPVNTEISGRVCCQLDLCDIQGFRLRSLFDWHYAEHHSASVFSQVLQSASEEYCCLDTFRGSHQNVLYVFCHNPMSPDRSCKEAWDVALHTDVKFRKYLEHVADSISDWTKEEELKREANQLRHLSPAESPEDEKPADSAEEEDALKPVIRKESLKAWKLEQDQLKQEEMTEKAKKEKTPKGKPQKERAESANSKKSHRTATAGGSAKTMTEEPFSGFTGYSMDGKLIHVSGHIQHLFPSDGGHITVEEISYVEGSSLLKVAVRKDGHHFYTHINQVVVDPAKPPTQPQDKETSGKKEDFKESEAVVMKRVKQGSLSAVLDNGIHLSYSFYGPSGEFKVSPQSSTHRSKETDVDSSFPKTHSPSRPPESQGCEGQSAVSSSPFNSLNLSVPNGLLLQFLREDSQGMSSEEQSILVKQSFLLHGRGAAGQLQDPSLSKELSRIVTSKGTVIRYMRDGSTEVLFADGSVSVSQESDPAWVPDSVVEEENTCQKAEDHKKEQNPGKEADAQTGRWMTTTPSGARVYTVGTTHKRAPIAPLLSYKATDPITQEVLLSREDLVVSVQKPDGSLSVQHADGTRITSILQERPPNTLQHILLHTEEQPESVTFKSTSECACGRTECVCVTRCADSMKENVHVQDTCDDEGEMSRNSTCDKETSGHAKLSECVNVCDESVVKGGTGAEDGKRSACESVKLSVSSKERVVLVEKEGCATVEMYPERHTAHVFLADGTVITGNNQGAYQVFPSSVGLLQIQSDGKCVYSSDPLVTPAPKGGTPTDQPGSYIMSHTEKVACDITDPDGNHFLVMEDGQVSLLNISPSPSALKQDEEEPEEDREMAQIHRKHIEHCPRLFLVYEDGSGTELLSSQTVEELLYHAYSDPTVAVLKEPLADTQDEFAITILKPSHQSVWSQWLLGKQNLDITPLNLRERSWHDFPRPEKKTSGPPFGTNMGRGLTLREASGGSAAKRQPVRSCPKVLEIRELHQHRPFTTPLKHAVDTRLKEYIESLMEREQRSEEMKVKDPRTEEERVRASDLLNLVLSSAEEEDAGHTLDQRNSEDIASLYCQGVAAQEEQSDVSEATATISSDSFNNGKVSKWAERHAQYRQELCEEQAYRDALRKKNVVPFFHPENTALYQGLLQHQTPDRTSLSMDLPQIPKSGSAEAFLKDAPQESTPRPLNPTPSQSASHAAGSDTMFEKRPTNPTPQTAGDTSLMGTSVKCKSVQVDVTGKPRKTQVRLPTSILSSKPRSVPNKQFLSVEEPVRRRCRTSSLTDPNVIVRGFQLLPSSVDFGTVEEGTTTDITVVMKNVGVDACRFHVKQPPLASGLRVFYNPGPVAAGLQVKLQVQLFAMCAGQAGEVEQKKHISKDITINTETDILYLPVTATILPERLYDVWLKNHTDAHSKKGFKARKLSSGLPAGQATHPPQQ